MPIFSNISKQRLASCHPDLQTLFNEVIKEFDCSIICGHRGQVEQEAAFNAGKSELHYPYGNHNAIPSNAVDVAPYPIDWGNLERFGQLAAIVLVKAKELKDAGKIETDIQWGGDWPNFKDYSHFERILT